MNTARHHEELDEYINNWLANYHAGGKQVFCRQGCPGCCSLVVHVTYPEATGIANALSNEQQASLQQYILRLKEVNQELTDLKNYLKLHRTAIGPCPFLDAQGRCSIYGQRPLSCRSLLSTRPADWCTVDFSTLNEWDKLAYESGLDRSVVAWPTHFVTATQDYARDLESQLLSEMHARYGWSLSGNLPLLVWLAAQIEDTLPDEGCDVLRQYLQKTGLDSELLVNFNNYSPGL